MSHIALPGAFVPSTCQLNLSTSQRVSAAPFGGSEQAVDLLNDRWLMSCELPDEYSNNGAWVEAFIAALRGQTNTTTVWHFARPVPLGTARGTLVLASAAAQGASSITVSGCVPTTGTLKSGDMLGVGGLLLMVASDCTAVAGVITVPLVNALRKALSSGDAVAWDKPTMTARLLATSGVGYAGSIARGASFDFGEKI